MPVKLVPDAAPPFVPPLLIGIYMTFRSLILHNTLPCVSMCVYLFMLYLYIIYTYIHMYIYIYICIYIYIHIYTIHMSLLCDTFLSRFRSSGHVCTVTHNMGPATSDKLLERKRLKKVSHKSDIWIVQWHTIWDPQQVTFCDAVCCSVLQFCHTRETDSVLTPRGGGRTMISCSSCDVDICAPQPCITWVAASELQLYVEPVAGICRATVAAIYICRIR